MMTSEHQLQYSLLHNLPRLARWSVSQGQSVQQPYGLEEYGSVCECYWTHLMSVRRWSSYNYTHTHTQISNMSQSVIESINSVWQEKLHPSHPLYPPTPPPQPIKSQNNTPPPPPKLKDLKQTKRQTETKEEKLNKTDLIYIHKFQTEILLTSKSFFAFSCIARMCVMLLALSFSRSLASRKLPTYRPGIICTKDMFKFFNFNLFKYQQDAH